jgi:trans-aconitate 2-methyltransferase
MPDVTWQPEVYARFGDERSRPFSDLVARIGAQAPARVVDLGCGPGGLTATLRDRWPGAQVLGIDSSPEMIAAAAPLARDGLAFRLGAVQDWTPDGEDVVVSNATLQWVPGHRDLLRGWAAALPAGAWLAFQVPGNFRSPSHVLMREVAGSARWRDRVGGVLRHDDAVAEPADYLEDLLAAGWEAEAWETTYLHVLPGEDPVLGWVRGTGLRPVLDALGPADAAAFEAEYAALLRDAYPPGPHGTTFPFRRLFCVGRRP